MQVEKALVPPPHARSHEHARHSSAAELALQDVRGSERRLELIAEQVYQGDPSGGQVVGTESPPGAARPR